MFNQQKAPPQEAVRGGMGAEGEQGREEPIGESATSHPRSPAAAGGPSVPSAPPPGRSPLGNLPDNPVLALASTQTLIAQIDVEAEGVRAEMTASRDRRQEISVQMDSLRGQLSQKESTLAQLNSSIHLIETEAAGVEATNEYLSRTIADLQRTISVTAADLQDLNEEHDRVMDDYTARMDALAEDQLAEHIRWNYNNNNGNGNPDLQASLERIQNALEDKQAENEELGQVLRKMTIAEGETRCQLGGGDWPERLPVADRMTAFVELTRHGEHVDKSVRAAEERLEHVQERLRERDQLEK